jgi:hypothetical protein
MNSLNDIQTPSPQACPTGQVVDQPKVQVPELVKYIALYRRVFSFSELSDAELLHEYQLIRDKKSKLSSSKRTQIKTIVLSGQAAWHIDKENGNLDRYNKLINHLKMMGYIMECFRDVENDCYAVV